MCVHILHVASEYEQKRKANLRRYLLEMVKLQCEFDVRYHFERSMPLKGEKVKSNGQHVRKIEQKR